MGDKRYLTLAHKIAKSYSRSPLVEAVVLGGSHTSGNAEPDSDIDLYVYCTRELPRGFRQSVAAPDSAFLELDNRFFEPGDEWIDRETEIHVDVMFRTVHWIGEQLDRVLLEHRGQIGYTTCFWYNIKTSYILFDRERWFSKLQQKANLPYPEELARNIVSKNYSLLGSNLSSYLEQIKKAVKRDDPVSLNHRGSALLASYFDIIFAVNRQLHPGEKRLLDITPKLCAKLPEKMDALVRSFLNSLVNGGGGAEASAENLIASLNKFLEAEKWIKGD